MITLTTYDWVPDFAAPLMRAFRVRWALEEAGLPYRVRTVALGPEQRSPEHLARQPFGQAPAIEEDGLACSRAARSRSTSRRGARRCCRGTASDGSGRSAGCSRR